MIISYIERMMDYSKLKDKTIFDFCKDEKIIADLVILSKEDFFQELRDAPS